jgi:hypothetical protein
MAANPELFVGRAGPSHPPTQSVCGRTLTASASARAELSLQPAGAC